MKEVVVLVLRRHKRLKRLNCVLTLSRVLKSLKNHDIHVNSIFMYHGHSKWLVLMKYKRNG